MEEGDEIQTTHHRSNWRVMSPEIVEIGEESRSIVSNSSRDGGRMISDDVYVAVGKSQDDLQVVKWAIDHAVSPGGRLNLVHVFPPLTYIPTPVGRLAKSQLSQEQVRVYINEENNKRRHFLQKYIRLCNDAQVDVDTMLLESNATGKAILDLIPVLNITNLVIGTKRPPSSRRVMKAMGKGEFVKKNAPEFCEVTIVHIGKKLVDGPKVVPSALAARHQRPEIGRQPEKNSFLGCVCFSVKSD